MKFKRILITFSIVFCANTPSEETMAAVTRSWATAKTLSEALDSITSKTYWFVGNHDFHEAIRIERGWGNTISLQREFPTWPTAIPPEYDLIFPQIMTLSCDENLDCMYIKNIKDYRTKNIFFATANPNNQGCENGVKYQGTISYILKLSFPRAGILEVDEANTYAELESKRGLFRPNHCMPISLRYPRFAGAYSNVPLSSDYQKIETADLCK